MSKQVHTKWIYNRYLLVPCAVFKCLELNKVAAYHLSKVQLQICQLTDAGEWPHCRSEGPCSSSTTHLPCSPPVKMKWYNSVIWIKKIIIQQLKSDWYRIFALDVDIRDSERSDNNKAADIWFLLEPDRYEPFTAVLASAFMFADMC